MNEKLQALASEELDDDLKEAAAGDEDQIVAALIIQGVRWLRDTAQKECVL